VKRNFFKDILGVAGTNTLSGILKFLIGVLLARALGPDGRGIYASILVVPMMIIGLTELGIKRSTIHHIGEKVFNPNDIISVLSFALIITSLLGIIGCTLVYYLLDNPNIKAPLIAIAVINIPVSLLTRFSRGIFLSREMYRKSNILNWTPVLANLVLLTLFIWIIDMYVFGALLALLMSNIIIAYFALRGVAQEYKIRVKYNFEILKSLIKLGFVFALALFIIRLNFRIDIILLERLSSFHEVGFYSVGSSIAEKWQIPFAFGGIIISKSANISDQVFLNRNIARLIRLTFIVGIIVSVIIFFIAPFIVPFIYGSAFEPSIEIVQAILPAVLLLAVSKIMSTRLAGLKKTKSVILIFIPALIVNIILNLILIPLYGGMGAVIATNASYAIAAVGVLIIYLKVTGTSFMEIITIKKDDFSFITKLTKRLKKK